MALNLRVTDAALYYTVTILDGGKQMKSIEVSLFAHLLTFLFQLKYLPGFMRPQNAGPEN